MITAKIIIKSVLYAVGTLALLGLSGSNSQEADGVILVSANGKVKNGTHKTHLYSSSKRL